jgi:hypothetical protein
MVPAHEETYLHNLQQVKSFQAGKVLKYQKVFILGWDQMGFLWNWIDKRLCNDCGALKENLWCQSDSCVVTSLKTLMFIVQP